MNWTIQSRAAIRRAFSRVYRHALAAACLAVTVTAVPAAAESGVPLDIQLVDSATGYAIQAVAAPSPAVTFPGAAPVQLAAEQADGWLRTDAATGVYQLQVESPEYFPFLGSLSVDPNGPRQVRVWLDPINPPSELRPEQIRSLHRADAMVLLGFVVDDRTGRPVQGVQVTCATGSLGMALSDASVETRSNSRGFFKLRVHCNSDASERRGTVRFASPGYRSEEIHDVALWPRGDWTYRIRLLPDSRSEARGSAIDDILTGPWLPESLPLPFAGSERSEGTALNPPTSARAALSLHRRETETANTLPKDAQPQSSGQPPPFTPRMPRNIRVLAADGTTIDYVSLEYYCRRVVPAEWIASWAAFPGGEHSLQAGAVAIRTYAIGYINHPRAATHDICGTTACQSYGPATSTYSDAAVTATLNYLMTDQLGQIPRSLTEYSAENNSLGAPCGDGFTSPQGGCLSDPVCIGESRNGHGRGMCQWGSARWATGLRFPGNSTRDRVTLNGYPRRDWVWILEHYYPELRLTQARSLVVGDAVKALAGVNVRACPDRSITSGIQCPALTVKAAGTMGVVVGGPIQVLADGGGYTWYQVRWSDVTGWSVENYLERAVDRPVLHASITERGVTLTWTARPGLAYRIQFKEQAIAQSWLDLTADLRFTQTLGSWSEPPTQGQRFYRVRLIPE